MYVYIYIVDNYTGLSFSWAWDTPVRTESIYR